MVPGEHSDHTETKQRTLDALRWGLIPSWAKDEKIAYETINARVETVDTAPSYRHQSSEELAIQSRLDGFEQCILIERLAQEIHGTACESLQALLVADPG